MSYIPNLVEARALLAKYNREKFHIQHGETVAGVMGWFAAKHDPENEEFWRVVGMLHDIDYELYPQEHCVKGEEIMRNEDIDERVIHSTLSHGYGLTGTPYKPENVMEKILYAVDELTGLIWAVSLLRPSKSVSDLELSSVKKKFKANNFAAGCSRDAIRQGAQMLGWELDELISETILAMRTLPAE
ncbi:MAG TPA: hydrolase [Methylomusa anaerophila]|uniref:tRNA 2'-O-methylase n=1 Tax=Methylomusa anaerophila TaxID=1930071 RepID=A0A348AIJ0_9FIRM|nr:HD domain-containing protein [Methylomusa anaerophila]BBB90888.1 tRNA 2'-O-methylase [Methylomusa anaerophila]HML90607.1 hydrolase [Methylomusa anaerophila]